MSYESFLEKQNGIFSEFHETHANIGVTRGIEKDPGTDPQGAFLVAWRYPDKINTLVEELSLEIADVANAIPYGPQNAHTTISDLELNPNYVIVPDMHIDEKETLDILSGAVQKALDLSGRETINSCEVDFISNLTNGKSVVATGIPTESVWQINQQVLSESAKAGAGLTGTWGTHMTMSRFLEGQDTQSKSVTELMKLLNKTPPIGPAKPSTIDVGYFYTTPTEGFVFTPYNRFELTSS